MEQCRREASIEDVDFTTGIGGIAAFFTTVSYFPQLKKCWETGKAGDLSLKMFAILATGVALWALYGFLKSDIVILVANVVSLALLLGILYFKFREREDTPLERTHR
jgi:MtN3 and saliva related transmembrane protein